MIQTEERKKSKNEEKESSVAPKEIKIVLHKEESSDIEEHKDIFDDESPDDENEDDWDFDFDDVQVHHAEGLVIKQNADEVRLLFFYRKPSMKAPSTYKAVTELRIPRRRFPRIADEIQQTINECNKTGHKQLQLPMFG